MLTISLPTLAGMLIAGLLGYFVGSVSSAIIVCRVLRLPDPRVSGSNNPGATNVLRLGGNIAAAITLLGDVFKGLLPVLVAKMISGYFSLSAPSFTLAFAGLGAFLGHLYPLFFGFRGGKGVATAAGVFIGWSIPVIAWLGLVWLLVALFLRYSSLAAVTAAATAPGLVWWLVPEPIYCTVTLIIVALLLYRHRGNIRRLAAGKEGKIRFGNKPTNQR